MISKCEGFDVLLFPSGRKFPILEANDDTITVQHPNGREVDLTEDHLENLFANGGLLL